MESNIVSQNPNAASPVSAENQMQGHNDVPPVQSDFAPETADAPEQEPQVDYAARAQELERQNAQLQTTLGNVRTWAEQRMAQEEQQRAQQEYQSREQAILDRADTMPSDDARRYIAEEMRKLRDETANHWQAQLEQTKRTLAKPMYVDNIVRQFGLTEEERQTLLSLENPDDAMRMAPYLKAQRDQYGTLQKQIDQLSRSQQAQQIQGTGIGTVGGQNAPMGNVELPSDPDERAAMIYAQLKSGSYRG